MKTFRILLIYVLYATNLLAQSPKAIETDLLSLFKKINYKNSDNTISNNAFGQKLKYYTDNYPSTISQNFKLLESEHLNILTSTDNLFRIYSWDTWTGGTMHFFENVFQYKTGVKTKSILDTPSKEGDSRPFYHKLNTFKAGGVKYYLALYSTIGSTKDAGQGIQIFEIENGKLNDVKIIKTQTGLHNSIYYNYDFFSVVDWKIRPDIYFDVITKTIHVPVVLQNGKVTHSYIVYKFNGQYFEKVKS